jgi:hypothetical protein
MGLPESAVRVKVLSEPERSLNWSKNTCVSQMGSGVSLLGGFFFCRDDYLGTDLIAHHDGECVAVVARRLSAPVAMADSLGRGIGVSYLER